MSRLVKVSGCLLLVAMLASGCGSSSKKAATSATTTTTTAKTTTTTKPPAKSTGDSSSAGSDSSAADSSAADSSATDTSSTDSSVVGSGDGTAPKTFCKTIDSLNAYSGDDTTLTGVQTTFHHILSLLTTLKGAAPSAIQATANSEYDAFKKLVAGVDGATTLAAAKSFLGTAPASLDTDEKALKAYATAHC